MQNTTTSISYLHNNSNPRWSVQFTRYLLHFAICEAKKQVCGLEWMLMHNCTSSTPSKPHFHLTRDPDLKWQIIYFNKLKLFKVITTQKFHKKFKYNLNIQFTFHLTTAFRFCISVEHLQSLAQILCRSTQKSFGKKLCCFHLEWNKEGNNFLGVCWQMYRIMQCAVYPNCRMFTGMLC